MEDPVLETNHLSQGQALHLDRWLFELLRTLIHNVNFIKSQVDSVGHAMENHSYMNRRKNDAIDFEQERHTHMPILILYRRLL